MNSWSALQAQLRLGRSWSGHEPDVAMINSGSGRFYDISYVAGVLYSDDARGVVFYDWDGDGDLDVWLRNRTGPQLRFLLNQVETGNRSLQVRLVGSSSNRDAIGARVEVLGLDKPLIETVRAGSGFLAQGPGWIFFGLGQHSGPVSIRVRWPSGVVETHSGLSANARYVITEGKKEVQHLDLEPPLGWPAKRIPEAHFTRTGSVALAYPPRSPLTGFRTFDNNVISVVGAGKATLINFWASWCAACLKEMEVFQERRSLLEDAGVQIVALSLDDPKDMEKAANLFREKGYWYQAGPAPAGVTQLFQALQRVITDREQDIVLPSSILVNSKGRIVKIYTGPIDPAELAADAQRFRNAEAVSYHLAVPWKGVWDGVEQEHSALITSLRLAEYLTTLRAYTLAASFARDALESVRPGVTPAATELRIANVYYSIADGIEADAPILAKLHASRAQSLLVASVSRLGSALAAAPYEGALWEQLFKNLNAIRDEAVGDKLIAAIVARLPDPTTPSETWRLGLFLFNGTRYREAKPYLERALALDPSNANAEYCLGVSLIHLGDVANGLKHVDAALDVLPPWDQAEAQVAEGLRQAGRRDLAQRYYERALRINPHNADAARGLRELGSNLASVGN